MPHFLRCDYLATNYVQPAQRLDTSGWVGYMEGRLHGGSAVSTDGPRITACQIIFVFKGKLEFLAEYSEHF